MKITYREVNGYLIPNLKLPPEEANIRLGKWGMMYKSHIEKYKKVLFSTFRNLGFVGRRWLRMVVAHKSRRIRKNYCR